MSALAPSPFALPVALPALLTLLGDRVNAPRLLRSTWAQSAGASAAQPGMSRPSGVTRRRSTRRAARSG